MNGGWSKQIYVQINDWKNKSWTVWLIHEKINKKMIFKVMNCKMNDEWWCKWRNEWRIYWFLKQQTVN